MFGKLKKFAVKKMLDSQLKNVPEDQKQMLMEMIENNPELFQKIATEMQAELKANGNNQMAAATKILPKYQSEIMAAMSPAMREKMMQMMGGKIPGQFRPDGTLNR